ncbi:MAG: FecR family protein [Natronospirillum sp.]|uniref:FecR family protein n=1 Tax=Natronospirillum sp. TaxID=2812955 RepID=UPI0025D1E6E1|nr:FecR family protein [Natronospirillum sp.]MCH8551460.1 FecR family protein [Natronospirillum sp.]
MNKSTTRSGDRACLHNRTRTTSRGMLRWPLLASLLLGLMLFSVPVLAADVIARVVSLQGSAQVSDGSTVQRGTALRAGDRIETGAESRARLRFIGGSMLTLGEQTELEITRYEPAQGGDPQQAHFRVLQGVFLAVAEGVTSADSEFRIETPAATMGIRGTIVWGGYFLPDQADYILLGGGPVEISNDLGSVLLTEAGQGTTVSVDQDGLATNSPDEPEAWTPSKLWEAVTTISLPGI